MFSFSYYIIFYYHAILPCMAIKCLFTCICYTLYTQSWQRICLNFSSLIQYIFWNYIFSKHAHVISHLERFAIWSTRGLWCLAPSDVCLQYWRFCCYKPLGPLSFSATLGVSKLCLESSKTKTTPSRMFLEKPECWMSVLLFSFPPMGETTVGLLLIVLGWWKN